MRIVTLQPSLKVLDVRIVRPAPKRAEPFYLSQAWRTLVDRLIAERGRACQCCGKTRETDSSIVRLIGDHVIERKDGGAELDPNNIRLLCCKSGGNGVPHADGSLGGCHAKKTARARDARFARAL